MSLKGVIAKDTRTGMYEATKLRARRALVEWLGELADGKTGRTLNHVAKDNKISRRKMLKILNEDEELQKEVFGPMTQDAQLGLVKAMAVGHRFLESEYAEVGHAEARRWGEFFAKVAGGMFEKGADGGPTTLLNLVTQIQLPAGFERAEARVLDDEEARRRFDGLL